MGRGGVVVALLLVVAVVVLVLFRLGLCTRISLSSLFSDGSAPLEFFCSKELLLRFNDVSLCSHEDEELLCDSLLVGG